MSPPNKTELIEELIKDIEDTAEQVHLLLTELNESKTDLAILKTELKFVVDNIKDLSHLIRNENNDGLSIIARIAIIEKSLEEIKDCVSEYKEITIKVVLLEQRVNSVYKIIENYGSKQQAKDTANASGKWTLFAATASGVLALIGTIVSLILQHC